MSFFNSDLLRLAKESTEKQAFVDGGAIAGQQPGGGGGQPPMDPAMMGGGGGGMPPGMPPGQDPAAMMGGGGAPPPPAGQPMPEPGSLEARIMALEAGGAGGAGGAPGAGKPSGSSKGQQQAETNLAIQQLVNMMTQLFDTLGIQVPTQAMIPQNLMNSTTPPPAQQPQGQPPAGGDQGSVLGTPQPPAPVAPMTSILPQSGAPGQPQAQPGGGAGTKSSAEEDKKLSLEGRSITLDSLKSAVADPTELIAKKKAAAKAPDLMEILGVKPVRRRAG